MIEIRNLTKVYKTTFKKSTIAINDISLDLPSTGMIFIIGKSGSGKSTLLNMIGTLDHITSGDIYIDGVSIKQSSDTKLQEYRSSYLGFIFQDFLLLNEFTVRENIELAVNIAGIKDDSIIDKVLEEVDLKDKQDKFPTELSGGQRQRVAIARALVKNPKLLLCDEPTGNLDYKTSENILKFLKQQSKNKLVIIVSHNLEDAENYADRIIELHEGKILTDSVKDINYINTYQELEDCIILPHHKDLTAKQVESLNNITKDKKLPLKQNKGGFIPTTKVESHYNEFTLSSSHLSRRDRVKISKIFFRKNKHGTPYTMIMLTLFMSLLYIFQVFTTFDGNKSLKLPNEEENIKIIKIDNETLKGTLSNTNIYGISEKEINSYYEEGYEGNIYPIYNYGFTMNMDFLLSGALTRMSSIMNYNYIKETIGTVCCDDEFIIKIYGKDNKLDILVGSLTDANNKFIITDYTAQCLIDYSKGQLTTYDDVYHKYNHKIACIINTNYKERYKKVLENGENAKEQKISSSDYINMYSDNELHIAFLEEVQSYLGMNYTFASYKDFQNNVFKRSTSSFSIKNIYVETKEMPSKLMDEVCTFNCDNSNKYKLRNNEVIMSYALYKQLFGKEYNQITATAFEPHSFKLSKYNGITSDTECLYEEEIFIKSLSSSTYVNENTFINLEKSKVLPYGLYFNNREFDSLIKDVSSDIGLYIYNLDTSTVPVINTIISVFRGFCILIIILLIVVCIVYLISFGIGTIKRNYYEIGVLKALGSKNIDIGIIFISQIVIVGIGVIIVSILGIKVFSEFSNSLLIKSFEDFITIKIFGLKIIPVKPSTMSFDLSLMFGVTLVSSVIPFIYLRTLKPLNILKGNKK